MKALARTLALTLSLLVVASGVDAQSAKRPLDHEDYDRWNRIGGEELSPDGVWLAYEISPGEGDGTLILRNLASGAQLSLARGEDATFTDDSRFLVATVVPAEDSVEAAEERREDDRSVELPNDELVIVTLADLFDGSQPDVDAIERIPDVDSFRVPGEGASVVAYMLEAPEEDEEEAEEEEAEEEPEEEMTPQEERREDKSDGAPLVLRELDSGAEHRFEHATQYLFDEEGAHLYYAASSKDGTADGVFRVVTGGGASTPLLTGEGRYIELAVSTGERGTGAVAFLADRDDQASEAPAFSLYAAGAGDDAARVLATAEADGIPEGWWITENGNVRFSEAGSRVFFGTAERPAPEPDEDAESEDDEDEVELDVWNWKDPYLQPMQIVRARNADDRAYDAVIDVDGSDLLQLETPEMESVSVGQDGEGDLALGSTDLPYRQLISWDGRYNDVYLIDMETGERELVLEMLGRGADLSPDGRWVSWFDGREMQWFAMDVESREVVDLTSGLPHAVHDELDDHPDEPPPYGDAGWTEDGRFVVYDAHDIWAVDPTGSRAATNLTEGLGRREGLRFRYLPTEPGQDFVPTDAPVLLSAFHLTRKDDGFYRDHFGGSAAPTELLLTAHSYGFPRIAEDDDDRVVITRETFEEYGDLYLTDGDFSDFEKLSEANPQQSEYSWGTAELHEWVSNDGVPLQGILYKPEGFDPSQEYPMMVYFYERSSDGLHNYTVPSAGSSSINRSFYVSRGYLLFVPDIPYEIGFPGESALDAVVPGVLSLIDEGFVDRDAIGVQGHSWGGYQIAYMVTRSNLFAAAEAGAPVSNMTSAYGGIRWASGMSRMFQYERTQSRIGGTLWNAQHKYIENSPVFFADKIETPVLMMHNDEDGAVPWYQGIEMFVAMRRLQKPVWLLNYNGEAHGLRQEQNQRDWAIRMQQFFDHYLKDAPPPVWLVEGVPAELKGESLGLELVTGPITEEEGGGGS